MSSLGERPGMTVSVELVAAQGSPQGVRLPSVMTTGRSCSLRYDQGTALSNVGSALREVRRFDEAITALQGAAAIFRETGDRYGEAIALNNLKTDQSAESA